MRLNELPNLETCRRCTRHHLNGPAKLPREIVNRLNADIARVLKLPEHKLRVVAPDVGGGFGSKIYPYAEEAVCAWASTKIKRPIKWTAEQFAEFENQELKRWKTVIEQGKIGLILSSRPTERRQLIEEAAGITKYRAKRRAAEGFQFIAVASELGMMLGKARENITALGLKPGGAAARY